MTSPRLPCCVPFCRRTTRPGPWFEWLCPLHWRLVDAEIKALRRRARRKGRRRLDDLLWRRTKCQAIERALTGGPARPFPVKIGENANHPGMAWEPRHDA